MKKMCFILMTLGVLGYFSVSYLEVDFWRTAGDWAVTPPHYIVLKNLSMIIFGCSLFMLIFSVVKLQKNVR